MLEFRHRMKMVKTLSIRDFALPCTGMSPSMLGRGTALFALARQVHPLLDVPAALSAGVAWCLPLMFAFVHRAVSVVTSAGKARPKRFRIGRVA